MKQIVIPKENQKKVNRLYFVAAMIVVVASIEALVLAKSTEILQAYLEMVDNSTIDDYVGIVIMNFLITIFEPVLISLYTFFTYKRFGAPTVYKVVFTVIVLLRLFNIVIKFSFNSIFYYLLIILYLLFIAAIITLPAKRKVKNGLYNNN